MLGFLDRADQDLRYGLRTLARSPVSSAVAILTLALAIGANVAIFSLLDAGLLRRLPIPDADRLVLMHWMGHHSSPWLAVSSFPGCENLHTSPQDECAISHPLYESLRQRVRSFVGMAAFTGPRELQVTLREEVTVANAEFVSGSFYSVLGLKAEIGRTLVSSDDEAEGEAVVVLAYDYWRDRFGSDPTVVGRFIKVNGTALMVVGVARRGFVGMNPASGPAMWIPLHTGARLIDPLGLLPRLLDDRSGLLATVGRLKPGVGVEQARSELELILRQVLSESRQGPFDDGVKPRVTLTSAARGLNPLRTRYGQTLRLLNALAGLVVVVVWANIGNVLLARACARRTEIALRLAIGATWRQLLGHLVAEGLLVSVLGALLGLALGLFGRRVLAALLAPGIPATAVRWIVPSGGVLALVAVGVATSALVFGLAQAFAARFADPGRDLRAGGGGRTACSTGGGGARLGHWLVTGEVAIALALVVAAGLLVRTVLNLVTTDPGFRTDHLLTFAVSPVLGHDTTHVTELTDELQSGLSSLPGIISVTWASQPLLAQRWDASAILLGEGAHLRSEMVHSLTIGPRFFETLEMPVLAGRDVAPVDCQDNARAVWVNRRFADRYLADRRPLGSAIRLSSGGSRIYEVAGVVADSRYATLRDEVRPTVYVPARVEPLYFLARTIDDPLDAAAAIQRAVGTVSPRLLVHHLNDQRQYVTDQIRGERLLALASLSFGLLALLLAVLGVYGVLSYWVARRTGEIAIRISLGAGRGDILKLVLGQGLRLFLTGAALGVVVSYWGNRMLTGLLFGVRPLDAPAYITAVLLLLASSALASYLPAARACRVDPIPALRSE